MEGYNLLRCIGQGVYGQVFEAERENGERVALKQMLKRGGKVDSFAAFEREKLAGEQLEHPNIVPLLQHFETAQHFYLVFELVDGMDLVSLLLQRDAPFSEQDSKRMVLQALDALKYCHSKGIAHLDVKLDNFLLDSTGTLRLIDFGLCTFQANEPCQHPVGSPEYCAPEVLRCKQKELSECCYYYSGSKADSWSLGVVLYALLFGQFPFKPEEVEDIAGGVEVPLVFPENISVSGFAKDLLRQLLHPHPAQRCSLTETAKHRWFNPHTIQRRSSSTLSR